MPDTIVVTVPKGAPERDVKAVVDDLRQADNVEDAGTMEARGLDPGALMLYVQAAGGVLGAVRTAVPLIGQLAEKIRGRGMKGVTIKLPNGTVISVDRAYSPADIEKLLRGVGRK